MLTAHQGSGDRKPMRDAEQLIAFLLAPAGARRGRLAWRTVHQDAPVAVLESFRVDGVNACRMVAVIVAPQQRGAGLAARFQRQGPAAGI